MISYLHNHPKAAAICHCDQDIESAATSAAQIVSDMYRRYGIFYKGQLPPSPNPDPLTEWAGDKWPNFSWVRQLTFYLFEQFEARTGEAHPEAKNVHNREEHDALRQIVHKIPGAGYKSASKDVRFTPPPIPKKGSRSKDPVYAFRENYLHRDHVITWFEEKEPAWETNDFSWATKQAIIEGSGAASPKPKPKGTKPMAKETAKADAAPKTEKKKIHQPPAGRQTGIPSTAQLSRANIRIVKANFENYRRPNSKGFKTMEILESKGAKGMTGAELEKAGGRLADVRWDLRIPEYRGGLKVTLAEEDKSKPADK